MAEYFYGITDKGKRREKNEDTFFVREIVNKRCLVACVIDGVGGYDGGDIAAAIARSVIMKKLETLSEDVIATLQQAIVAANTNINLQKKAGAKNERMACVLTCAVVDIENSKCWYAHVGDTRIYLLRDRSLIKISKDHSVVGFLEESGKLSEEEAMRHPRRNEINKALGFEEEITTADDFIETGESPFLSGDLLLLCSDGLTDMISSATIISLLTAKKSLGAKAKSLIDAANDAGGNDNITVVLVENNKQPKQKPAPVRVQRKIDTNTSSVAVGETLPEKDSTPSKKNRSSRLVLSTLLVATLVAIAVLAAFEKSNAPKAVMPAIDASKKSELLSTLIAQINDSAKTAALPAGITALEVKAPLVISKDSFYFNGNGATIVADSACKGPAFIIKSSAKNIVLDSLVFKNFDVGVLLQKSNLTLKSVRFINCRIPVQYAILFTDSLVSGKFKDSIFITHSKLK
jgi:serine/threonine protein phosphatase PrpC